MIKSSIEKLANPIGYDIGNSDNVVQADLLNGLAKGLRTIAPDSDYDKQLCYVADELSDSAVKMIETLYEFCQLNKEKKE